MVDYGLCHGYAGNAVILKYLARNTGNERLRDVSEALTKEIVATFDQNLALGYEAVLFGQKHADPGFLTGASGIGLALLTLTDRCDDFWLDCLGLHRSAAVIDKA